MEAQGFRYKLGLIGILFAIGRSLMAMSGEDSLSHLKCGPEQPKHKYKDRRRSLMRGHLKLPV
jgi:hypothetical protein